MGEPRGRKGVQVEGPSFARGERRGRGEVWAAAYVPIVCLKANRYGNRLYKYEVEVVFRLHFGNCNERSNCCSVGNREGVLP